MIIPNKTRLLYVHGLGGTKNGSTSKNLLKIAKENNIEFFSFDVPFNPYDAINSIEKFIKENNINLLISSSLGAFYSLFVSLKEEFKDLNVIVINPAFHASKDILLNFGKGIKNYRGEREDKIQTYNLNDEYYEALKTIEEELHSVLTFEKENNKKVFLNWAGYFSNNDEYFSYKNEFEFYSPNTFNINDTHHINYDNLKQIINDYLSDSYLPF